MTLQPPHSGFGAAACLPRLLIADDDSTSRSALAMQLENQFQLVGTAKDAEEAIARAEEHRPDVALLDVEMPAGGGIRATREISARVPHTAIVILSADEQHDCVLELLSAGAITYCRKGLPARELASKLSLAIAAHIGGAEAQLGHAGQT